MGTEDVRERVTPFQRKSGSVAAVVTEFSGTSHEVIRRAKCKMLEAMGTVGRRIIYRVMEQMLYVGGGTPDGKYQIVPPRVLQSNKTLIFNVSVFKKSQLYYYFQFFIYL